MAVKTEFSQDDFIKILSTYELGEYRNFLPIIKGTVQTNYLLRTTKGKFVFRYYENRSFGSVLFEADLIKYLNEKKYPCPHIFKNKRREYVGIFNKKPFVLYEFVEGEHVENPSEYQKQQLIRRAADLQNVTKDFQSVYLEERWNYNIELCRALAQKEAKRINTSNANSKLKWFENELRKINLPADLPKGICHCDFHFSNVLFKDGEFKALIDFDDANYTYMTFDLAMLINPFVASFDWNTWSTFYKDENVFDFHMDRNVVKEYEKYRQLAKNEKEHLFDVYKLSIMFDSVWYFERGDADDFYEKRKIDSLNTLGKDKFYSELFSKKE